MNIWIIIPTTITIGILLVGVVLYIRGTYKKSLKSILVGMDMIRGPVAVAPVILVWYLQSYWNNLQIWWKAIAILGYSVWLFFYIFILVPKWRKKIERKYSE